MRCSIRWTTVRRGGPILPSLPILSILLLFCAPFLPAESRAQSQAFSDSVLRERLALFAPARIEADPAALRPSERRALGKIVEAGRLVERAYLRQVWATNEEILRGLESDTSAGGRLRLRYFLVNMSPWSLLDRLQAFLDGVPARKPPQANLYPREMRRSDWGGWFIGLDARGQAEASGPRHALRRDSAGTIVAVPYSVEYRDLLGDAAALLGSAAGDLGESSVATALKALAAALLGNDYAASERAAVAATGAISAIMGPTNPAIDEFFRYKRGFDVVIGILHGESAAAVGELERFIAGPDRRKLAEGFADTATRRITVRVDDAVFIGGGARAGAVASTVRLPSEDRAPGAGEKTILLRNVHARKFEAIQRPIAGLLLAEAQAASVSFDAYLRHQAAHELMHRYDREPASSGAEAELNDPWPPLDEAAADLAALVLLDTLAATGRLDGVTVEALHCTQVSGLLRALRFRDADPFTASAAIQFNFHRERGALSYDPAARRYAVDAASMRSSVRALAREIAALRSGGDHAATMAFHQRYTPHPAELASLALVLSGIPYDIEPEFPAAE